MKKYKFTISGNTYEVEVKSFEENIAKIEVNGTKYNIEVNKEVNVPKTPKLVRRVVSAPTDNNKPAASSGITKIEAPLPGIIMQIMVKAGDEVSKGQKLLTYEAMKMENNVLAEKDGVIKTIKVQSGDNVLQGDILIEIE